MKLPIAEIFTSPQGEGLYTGQLMTFIRTVGCSVGKGTCHACDTNFEEIYPWKGGREISSLDELEDVGLIRSHHICFTGGEPLNHDLTPFMKKPYHYHIETSGTVYPQWLRDLERPANLWVTVSPKPGWRVDMIKRADEVKVIVPGLGHPRDPWPSIDQALRWADEGKLVYVQPRNHKNEVDRMNLQIVLDVVHQNPSLRLSPQLHKFLSVR